MAGCPEEPWPLLGCHTLLLAKANHGATEGLESWKRWFVGPPTESPPQVASVGIGVADVDPVSLSGLGDQAGELTIFSHASPGSGHAGVPDFLYFLSLMNLNQQVMGNLPASCLGWLVFAVPLVGLEHLCNFLVHLTGWCWASWGRSLPLRRQHECHVKTEAPGGWGPQEGHPLVDVRSGVSGPGCHGGGSRVGRAAVRIVTCS